MVRQATVDRGWNPGAGAWFEVFLLPQPTMPPLISPPDFRVACDAPIVRVAHGWGGGVEALKKNNPIFFG